MVTQCLIGELASQLEISPSAIRYYEKLGLITPTSRNKAGYRLYSEEVKERLKVIRYSQSFGLSLNEIKELLEIELHSAESHQLFQQMLQKHLSNLDAEIQDLTSSRQVLGRRLEQISTLMLGQSTNSPQSASQSSLLNLIQAVESTSASKNEGDTIDDSTIQLLDLYAQGERDFQGLKLIGAKLNGILLSGIDLSRSELMLASLNEASLDHANLRGAYLSGADMIGAYLHQTDFTGAILMGTNLSESELSEASLVGSNLGGACLTDTNLEGANLCEAILIGADLRGANLKHANLLGCNFLDANLEGAVIERSSFEASEYIGIR